MCRRTHPAARERRGWRRVAVADALIELCQADADGTYPQAPAAGMPLPPFSGFGRLGTNDEGWCTFETVRPGAHGTADAREAAHIAVCVFARGLLRHLYTRIYFEGDPRSRLIRCSRSYRPDRRATLLAPGCPTARGSSSCDCRVIAKRCSSICEGRCPRPTSRRAGNDR